MIIFNLDGTLADCEHRRHFVDMDKYRHDGQIMEFEYSDGRKWKPDWKSFYEACDKDIPIESVIRIWNDQISLGGKNQIWSGRCESVRKKTEEWLDKNLLCFESHQLKMRPIGDYTPDDELKEKWLNEYIESMWPKLEAPKEDEKQNIYYRKDYIDFVFDSDPKSIEMWKRIGIFVFDCNQEVK